MRIGELARRAGCSPKAVRLYESRGLLGAVLRSGTYRQYGERDLAVVQLIRQALGLGFQQAPGGWERVAALVSERRAAVAQELLRLQALDAQLCELQQELRSCEASDAACRPLPQPVAA
ncbi:MAG: MerR family transcriptional regulator [Comamonas sp.]